MAAVEALTRNVQSLFARIIGLLPYLPEELQLAAASVDDPSALCNLIGSTMRLKTEEKQTLLETEALAPEAVPAGTETPEDEGGDEAMRLDGDRIALARSLAPASPADGEEERESTSEPTAQPTPEIEVVEPSGRRVSMKVRLHSFAQK